MQLRTKVILAGLLLALAVDPARARVGVDESLATATRPAAPQPDGGTPGGGSPGRAGYDDQKGGFHIGSESGDFNLTIGGRLTPRFDFINWDPSLSAGDRTTFQLRWARLYLLGNLMGKRNTYYVQLAADSADGLTSASTASNDFQIADAWLKRSLITDHDAAGAHERLAVKAGQFKVPFGRQAITSSGRLQFPERSLALLSSSILGGGRGFDGRDLGIELSGATSGDKLQYALAVVNGDGRNRVNLDTQLAYYARLSLNPSGTYGYEEGDLDETESAATTIGAAVHYQKDRSADVDASFTRVNVDGGIKYRGLSVQGEFFLTHVAPSGEVTFDNKAFYLQAGYFLSPRSVEVVARASRVMLEGDGNDRSEYSAGLGLYTQGHRMKWQLAYSYLDYQTDVKHHRVVGQAQYWF